MKDFKVLLIQANSTLDTLIPPNLAIISAVLKQANIQVKLFDTTFYKTRDFTGDDARVRTLQVQETNFEELGITLNTTDMYDDFMKVVRDYQPDLVGLSAVELTYLFGIKFLKKLREEGFTIPTIVGGVHATISSEEVLKEECVDYVCVGEGEYALKELCEALRDHRVTTSIQNIWTKKLGTIIKNPVRPPVNMNELPFQDWEIFDKRRLFKPMGGKIRKTGCFELNRGCPYSCTYCCNEFFHKLYNFKNYRERSVRKFIDEVKIMKEKYDLAYVYISAESFLSTKQERFEEFVKLWKEEIKLPFWAETRPESITEERVKLLEDAGCTSMSIGVESGSPEIRKMLNRHMTNERIKEAFKALKKTNLRVGANCILGFPGETREQVFETIELNREINADNSMIHVFNPYRGTQLFDTCVEKGYISKYTLGGDYRADAMLKMPQLSQDEIMGLQRTFALYVKLPKERWPEIRIAEKFDEVGNQKFAELKKEYTEKYFTPNIKNKDYDEKKGWDLLWEKKGDTIQEFDPIKLNGYDNGTMDDAKILLNQEINEIKHQLKLSESDKLLEIGCGAGRLLIPLSNIVNTVAGTDLASSLIKRFKEHYNFELYVSGAEKVPFEDKSFDKILINSVFHYFPDLDYAKRAVLEAIRVCKNGGKIMIMDIPDLAKKNENDTYRKTLAPVKTQDPLLVHRFYSKDFFKGICSELDLECRIIEIGVPGYENSKFRYNVLINKNVGI